MNWLKKWYEINIEFFKNCNNIYKKKCIITIIIAQLIINKQIYLLVTESTIYFPVTNLILNLLHPWLFLTCLYLLIPVYICVYISHIINRICTMYAWNAQNCGILIDNVELLWDYCWEIMQRLRQSDNNKVLPLPVERIPSIT